MWTNKEYWNNNFPMTPLKTSVGCCFNLNHAMHAWEIKKTLDWNYMILFQSFGNYIIMIIIWYYWKTLDWKTQIEITIYWLLKFHLPAQYRNAINCEEITLCTGYNTFYK